MTHPKPETTMGYLDKRCPECGGETTFGFGLAGGGEPGGYSMCTECNWFDKPESDGRVSCLHQAETDLASSLRAQWDRGELSMGEYVETLIHRVSPATIVEALLSTPPDVRAFAVELINGTADAQPSDLFRIHGPPLTPEEAAHAVQHARELRDALLSASLRSTDEEP